MVCPFWTTVTAAPAMWSLAMASAATPSTKASSSAAGIGWPGARRAPFWAAGGATGAGGCWAWPPSEAIIINAARVTASAALTRVTIRIASGCGCAVF